MKSSNGWVLFITAAIMLVFMVVAMNRMSNKLNGQISELATRCDEMRVERDRMAAENHNLRDENANLRVERDQWVEDSSLKTNSAVRK